MITASIVTYNTDIEELSNCLKDIELSIIKRVYVIDNSSRDYIKQTCKGFEKAEYIASENRGFGAGHNIAIREAMNIGSKYHIVMNSDISFESSAIEVLYNYMESNPDVAQAQPKITYPNGEVQYTCRLLPTPANLIFRRFLPKNWCKKMDDRYLLKNRDLTKEMNIPYHQGSFIFFRTECFKKVGLFDERFFMYPEDIDITRRMHAHYRTMYVPYTTIIHNHRAESYKNRKMLKIHIINMIKYFNKWGWVFDKERRFFNEELVRGFATMKNEE